MPDDELDVPPDVDVAAEPEVPVPELADELLLLPQPAITPARMSAAANRAIRRLRAGIGLGKVLVGNVQAS